MRKCHCTDESPTLNIPYTLAKAREANMRKAGLVQVKCKDCGRFSVWVHRTSGLPPKRREYAFDDMGF